MKIAWFTPFMKNSAIGMVGRLVCEELSKTAEIDIWTHHKEKLIKTSVNVITFSAGDKKLDALDQYDHIIYNLGNFAGNHREIYDVSCKHKGVIILHDQTMRGFWGQYYAFAEFGGDPVSGYANFNKMMKKYYGEGGESDAILAQQRGEYAFYECPSLVSYKMLEPIVENARGIFSHAKFFCEDLKKIYNGPIAYSYLPCEQENDLQKEDLSDVLGIINTARKEKRKIIVSNGIVHPVKQIDKVVQVLLDHAELRDKICYIVVGNCDGPYGDQLKQYAEKELRGCLNMMGYRSYGEMNRAIEEADLCFNLRYPNSEVCSLSLLEQMAHEKGVVVIDSGIYGEMPDDSVIKVRYHRIQEDICEVLSELVDHDQSKYMVTARNAGQFVDKNCTTKVYCEKLMEFLYQLSDTEAVKNIQNNVISSIAEDLEDCGFSVMPTPTAFLSKALSDIFNEINTPDTLNVVKTIGVWAAFNQEFGGLSREGISRFMEYLVLAYVKKYGVRAEFWCYSFNEDEIKVLCKGLPKGSYSIITEKNWADVFDITGWEIAQIGEVNASLNNLNLVARRVSKADIMLPLIIYLDSVIATGKRIFVPAHDMAVSELFDYFVSVDPMYKFRQADIAARAENLAKAGGVFFSNSDAVRKGQNLKHVKNLREENTAVIYYPTNIPADIKAALLPYEEIRDKYGITKPYLFFPTQIRPYKNVGVLIEALAKLVNDYPNLQLVLTGNPEDVPIVKKSIDKLGLSNRVKTVRNVSTEVLFSLYKYAEATPVPSLFEGGFPYQACEALYMETPVAMADIEITRERVASYGFDLKDSGIEMFDPKDAEDLARALRSILDNRGAAVLRQKEFAEVLLNHSWEETVKAYNALFERNVRV